MARTWSATMLTPSLLCFACLAGAQSAVGDPCSSSGQIVVTDPAGDGAASNPQLDILEIRIAEHLGGPYDGRLVVRLRVDRLETPYPAPAAWWTLGWYQPSNAGQLNLVMSTCGSQAPTFTYSFSDNTGSGSSGAPDTAWISSDGEIAFVVGRDKIGNPQPGDSLVNINGLTLQFARAEDLCLPAVIQGQDAAGPGIYVVGSCVLAAPIAAPVASFRVGFPVPNPTTRSLRLALEVPQALAGLRVDAGAFDVTGRRVRRLDEHDLVAGRSQIAWDLRGDDGIRVRPGTYWLRIRIANQLESRCVQVLR